MSRSRARLAADWFAKLRQNAVTNVVEHIDVTDVSDDVTVVSGTALHSGSPLNAANLTGALPAIDGSALTGVGGSTTYGAVGTYVIANRGGYTATIPTAGATYAGSGLYATGFLSFVYAQNGSSNNIAAGLNTSSLGAGTWRAMGRVPNNGRYSYYYPATLFVRIS
jgi:hypothetical protein